MNRRGWNALRVGDHVLVHDDGGAVKPVVPGRVTEVQQTSGSSLVSIRVKPRGEPARIVQPRPLMVHLDSGEVVERCWRCEVHYAAERS